MNAETRIHSQIVRWWALASKGYKLDERLLFHPANGGYRRSKEAAILKGLGVRAGLPDLGLMVPFRSKEGIVPGRWIELKAPNGRVGPLQTEIIDLLQSQGFAVEVCWSFDEAIGAICNYLKTGNPKLKST